MGHQKAVVVLSSAAGSRSDFLLVPRFLYIKEGRAEEKEKQNELGSIFLVSQSVSQLTKFLTLSKSPHCDNAVCDTLHLKANFCEDEKEGHFHYKNLRELQN